MQILVWKDNRDPCPPRIELRRGDCSKSHCGQFSISISDGERGITVHFTDREEFERFLQRGELEA